MFILYANKNQLTVRKREPVTSGSVNVYRVRFDFSDDWDGMSRTAIFRAGAESRAVLLDDDNETVIPWEVLKVPSLPLYCGVYGAIDSRVVLPTIWASLGTILEGAPGDSPGARPPTPDLWEQELAKKGDALAYDGLNLSLLSGDKTLSSVEITGGGGEGGTSDHRLLSNRDAEGQHPIDAITGLRAALESIPIPMTAEQLRKILMNGGTLNG